MDTCKLLTLLDNAMLAYSDHPRSLDFQSIRFEESCRSGVQYYIGRQERSLLIAFRGTDSLKDVVADLRFWRKCIPYDNTATKIRVHTGFLNAYKSPEVRQRILSSIPDDVDQITATGHSYGAALAVLCAVDLQYNYPDHYYEVALFGCPRVGNKAFQKSYDKRVYKTLRIENGNDLVTKVPPVWLGFRHVGIRIHVGQLRFPLFASFRQHNTKSYYEKLWKL